MNSGTGGPVPGDIDRTHMVTTLMIISWIIDFKSLDIFTLLFFFFTTEFSTTRRNGSNLLLSHSLP